MSYHKFKDEETGEEYGSFEAFYHPFSNWEKDADGAIHDLGPGWYWHACSPGYLPDGDQAYGPFETEAEAIADALGESP